MKLNNDGTSEPGTSGASLAKNAENRETGLSNLCFMIFPGIRK